METSKVTYLDHAATTPIRPEALAILQDLQSHLYGNASSIYSVGRQAKTQLDEAREIIAGVIHAQPNEVFFTSGGTESDNWALRGAAAAYAHKGKHIITTGIEHHAIFHTCQRLAKEGYDVTYLPVDEYGRVDPETLRRALRPDTILVSIMAANNEIGTLQPLKALAEVAHEQGALFHSDAVQAGGAIPLDMQALGLDLCSFSSHKMYGPKGVGALYVRRGLRLRNLLEGGAQERNKRPGTENVPAIRAFAECFRLSQEEMPQESKRLIELRDHLIDQALKRIPHSRLNGHPVERLPNNVNLSFEFIEGESILLLLDSMGFCCSSGSACTSGSLDPSHVLLSIGLPHEIAHGSVRATLGHETTLEAVDRFVDALEAIVKRLRDMSPLYDDYLKAQQKR